MKNLIAIMLAVVLSAPVFGVDVLLAPGLQSKNSCLISGHPNTALDPRGKTVEGSSFACTTCEYRVGTQVDAGDSTDRIMVDFGSDFTSGGGGFIPQTSGSFVWSIHNAGGAKQDGGSYPLSEATSSSNVPTFHIVPHASASSIDDTTDPLNIRMLLFSTDYAVGSELRIRVSGGMTNPGSIFRRVGVRTNTDSMWNQNFGDNGSFAISVPINIVDSTENICNLGGAAAA